MMRVPGSNGSLLDAKARGADVRFVYSPLDALKLAADSPEKQVVFFAVGFETTAPSTAVTLLRARELGVTQLQRVLQPRHDRAADQGHPGVARPAPRRLPRPGPRLDRGRATGPTASCRRSTASRSWSPGSSRWTSSPRCAMLLDPAPRRPLRGGEPVLARGRRGGQPRGAALMAQVFALRPHFEWRGLGFIAQSALKLLRRLRRVRRRAALVDARRAGGRPEGVPVRRGAQGRAQAVGVQGVRHRVHPGDADRHLHGVAGGRVRGLLQLRADAP